jgi:hypothetical protein
MDVAGSGGAYRVEQRFTRSRVLFDNHKISALRKDERHKQANQSPIERYVP